MAATKERVIGGFRVLQEIQAGSGSQGTVYKAVCDEDRHHLVPVGTVVALKVMAVQDEGRDQWRKLEKRTRELVRLTHPNVVKYYGCFAETGLFNDVHVIVQEFLSGETLKAHLARHTAGLDVDVALKIVDAALAGLVYTSGNGIVHRDVKPGNIFLCDTGEVKLIDFEIARQDGGTVTASAGNIRGSFDYMAPDFTDAAFHGDVCSDVFSMGVVLHEVLTGKTPYRRLEGDQKQANFAFLSRWAHVMADGENPIRISSRIKRLLAHTEDVLAKALAPRRTERYADFTQFREGMRAIRFRNLRNGDSTYQMLQFIGKGGFGEVFKARLRQTGELVAVKHLLKANYAERFYREAKIMKRLRDPSFVQFVDFFMVNIGNNREAFLVMAFLDGMPGSSLRDAIRAVDEGQGRLDATDVLCAFERYARGLQALHGTGVFHRDIKPSNLYYPAGHPERAAIMDLGIARDVNGTATHGQVPGTLDYMPPEVVVTENRGDGGMDVYALGLCFYEALTGRTAYPRLPSGSAAYAAFFERAKSRQKPVFDDSAIQSDSDLLALLTDMTNPDWEHRLRDATTLVERIVRIRSVRDPQSSRRVESVRTADDAVTRVAGAVDEALERTIEPTRIGQRTIGAQTIAPTLVGERTIEPTHGTVATQWAAPDLAAIAHERAAVQRQRQRRWTESPFVRFMLGLGACTGGLVAVVGLLLFFFGPSVKNAFADFKLNEILREYQLGHEELGLVKENRWRTQWNPESYGWLKLDAARFAAAVQKLTDAKKKIEAAHAEEARLQRIEAERRQCLDRTARCRQADGSLHEGNYGELNGWELPESMKGDEEIVRRFADMSKCLMAAVRDKLAVEPPLTRRKRLQAAQTLMDNSWTRRILSDVEYADMTQTIARVSTWCVGVVHNGCDEAIEVEGREIAPGGSIVVTYEDGRPAARRVSRRGYEPASLPKDLDGRICEIVDRDFVPKPVRVEFPALDAGVTCNLGDRAVVSRETIALKPGVYACTYARETYNSQTVAFTVRVNVMTAVPEPGPWVHTDAYLKKVREQAEKERIFRETPVEVTIGDFGSGVTLLLDNREQQAGTIRLKPGTYGYRYAKEDHVPQTGELEVRPGVAARLPSPGVWEKSKDALERERAARMAELQRALMAKCRALMAVEPIEDRQERLEKARRLLTKAIVDDGIISEEATKSVEDEIRHRSQWVVGRVRNECRHLVVRVGGRAVAPGRTELLTFEKGLPEDWCYEADGYEKKELMRDFDGRTLVVDERELVPRSVSMAVPALEKDVVCSFEGMSIRSSITLKPGAYSCVYRRKGYVDQPVAFEVFLGKDGAIPAPGAWKAKPVSVLMRKVGADVTCRVDGKDVMADILLDVGQHVCEYLRPDFQTQTRLFVVAAGTPMTLPAPDTWKETDGLRNLFDAERLARQRDWNAAEKLLGRTEVLSEVYKLRKRKVSEQITQQIGLKKKAEKALLYYDEELYYDAIRFFHEAQELGYLPTPDDLRKVDRAYQLEKTRLQQMLDRCYKEIGIGRTPIRPVKDVEREKAQLVEWYDAISALR